MRLILLLIFTLGAPAALAAPAAAVSGEAAPPEPSDVVALATPAILEAPALAPSGRYVAGISHENSEPALVVLGVDPGIEPWLVTLDGWRLNWFEWLPDDRLLLGVMRVTYSGLAASVGTRLLLVDPGRRKLQKLLRSQDHAEAVGLRGRLLSTLPGDPDHVLLDLNPRGSMRSEARLLSLKKHRYIGKAVQPALPHVLAMSADARGRVRVGWGLHERHETPRLWLLDGDGRWHDYSDEPRAEELNILAMPTADPDLLYVASDHEYPLGALYEFHVSRFAFGRELIRNADSEIAAVTLSADGAHLDAVHFSSEYIPSYFADPWLRALNDRLDDLLPDTSNAIVSFTPDRTRALVYASASDQPPIYFVFDRATMSLNPFAPAYPELMGRPLARTTLSQYEARDGLLIQAYVTLPRGAAAGTPLPFVVLPHGGPASRDFLRFDWLVQLFTSRGYGVLQMNFRGSTGYGRSFRDAGRRQWGKAMQDDVTDGTRWLVEQGLADPDRIAIVGGSYGGYAALMGIVREPELYRCAISLNGVTDLPKLLAADYEFHGGAYMNRHVGDLWKDREDLSRYSPARRAEDMQVPVLLVHGREDLVVDVAQSRAMQRSLEAAGGHVEYLELPRANHGLSRGEDRLAFARAALAFLDTQLALRSAQ
ncbi:MAG: prolyl oligopeptidase family serine peptidase [Pseudomonadota bacterium]